MAPANDLTIIHLPEFAAQPNSLPAMPTVEAYGLLQIAFSFFNDKLFDRRLPECLITLTRSSFALGYFCAGAFANRDGQIAHEISMNPRYLTARGDALSYSTLAHEMAHMDRHLNGRPNRKGGKGVGGYHDVVWAETMIRIGLMPSNTGAPDGKRTGYGMSHYIMEGGSFEGACSELLGAGYAINWGDAQGSGPVGPAGSAPLGLLGPGKPAPRNTRTRFVCEGCELSAWSRRSARLSCTDCTQSMVPK